MKKRIFTILTIFLIATSGMGFVSAENMTETDILNTTRTSESEEENRIGDEVKSDESGNYNISFDDGYNGYCINYGDNAADYMDSFTVQNTSLAVNHNSRESVGNHLKTFFVDFYDIAVKDKYETQRIIWAFTDDYDYHNKTLLDNIREKSFSQVIPDNGATRKINDTTEATFYFEVLDSVKDRYQNFFGYKIIYNEIPIEVENETSSQDPSLIEPETNKTTENNEINETIDENVTDLKENETNENLVLDNKEINDSQISDKLENHVTGTPFSYLLGIFLIACCITHIRNRR